MHINIHIYFVKKHTVISVIKMYMTINTVNSDHFLRFNFLALA